MIQNLIKLTKMIRISSLWRFKAYDSSDCKILEKRFWTIYINNQVLLLARLEDLNQYLAAGPKQSLPRTPMWLRCRRLWRRTRRWSRERCWWRISPRIHTSQQYSWSMFLSLIYDIVSSPPVVGQEFRYGVHLSYHSSLLNS